MSFTQSVFILKNMPELIRKLKNLGLEILVDADAEYLLVQHGAVVGLWSKTALEDLKNNGVIDCETNEELFLALAALRDDSDYMQWFVWGNRWMLWNHDYSPQKAWTTSGISNVFLRGHKATVEEIIKCFETKHDFAFTIGTSTTMHEAGFSSIEEAEKAAIEVSKKYNDTYKIWERRSVEIMSYVESIADDFLDNVIEVMDDDLHMDDPDYISSLFSERDRKNVSNMIQHALREYMQKRDFGVYYEIER